MTTNLTALYGLNQSGNWRSQLFTQSGTWQKPSNVQTIKVLLVGGGGGGAGGGITQKGIAGTAGQDSTITVSPFTITARGGQGGSNQGRGGSGGGAYTHERTAYRIVTTTAAIEPYPVTGNGGLMVTTNTTAIDQYPSIQTLYNGLAGIPAGDSVSGAGGAFRYVWGYSYTPFTAGYHPSYAIGGSIAGFGAGGIAGGGGASFGNGGSGRYRDPITSQYINQTPGVYGGGGAGGDVYGAGGGGGEIVIREIPVTSDVIISIGQGGASNGNEATAGGSGLCIIYWWQ